MLDDTLRILFPLIFLGGWIAVTTLLSYVSNWYKLMKRYPDQNEPAILVLTRQSGSMSFVNMRNILNLEVCPSGLRIGISRIFGPFCKNIFIPWAHLTVERKENFVWKSAILYFGPQKLGRLQLDARVANRIARSTGNHWPESGLFPTEPVTDTRLRIFKQWLIMSSLAAMFFTIVPFLTIEDPNERPPIAVAILFPTIVFGVVSVVRFFFEKE